VVRSWLGSAMGWGAKFVGTVGSLAVVVLNVLREYHTQVPLAEDQHVVGEFGSEVRMNRLVKQFTRGQCGGIVTTRGPHWRRQRRTMR
jgi:hypothetical protein